MAPALVKILAVVALAGLALATPGPTPTPVPVKCDCIHDVRCFVDLAHCQTGHAAVTLGYGSRLQCLNHVPSYTIYDCWEEVVNNIGNCRDVNTCRIIGGGNQDPHFKGFDKSDYYFDGVSGRDYNIITDVNFQLNARFVRLTSLKGTYMGRLGFRFGSDALLFDSYFGVFFNGTVLTNGIIELPAATISVDTVGSAIRLRIETDVYHISARNVIENGRHAESYINMEASLNGSPIDAHGVLGQTARNNGAPVQLDLSESSFLVQDGIFGVKFPVNRFQQDKFGALASSTVALAARRFRDGKTVSATIDA